MIRNKKLEIFPTVDKANTNILISIIYYKITLIPKLGNTPKHFIIYFYFSFKLDITKAMSLTRHSFMINSDIKLLLLLPKVPLPKSSKYIAFIYLHWQKLKVNNDSKYKTGKVWNFLMTVKSVFFEFEWNKFNN